jgi:pimeloyl-ACP methyl ester carboxylesterase
MMAVHEMEALPHNPVNPGDKWQGANVLGLEFHLAGPETISGKPCLRVEGNRGEDRLTYWWCPTIGAIGKIEVDGTYSIYESTMHEKLTFELQDKKRNETTTEWLKSPDTQLGALNALLVSHWAPLQTGQLTSPLQLADPKAQAEALAVIHQRRLEWPNQDVIKKLSQSSDAQVKRIAARILDQGPPQPTSQVGKCALPQHTYPAEKPGTSLRFMRNEKYRGELYMLHVPMDYRSDRPFPLLVYLSGGAGLAMDAVNTAEDVIAPSGYLVIYPQAAGLWWTPDTTSRFAALLEEVLQDLNVDRDRVYITGFSNGGTGSLYYAALWPQRFAAVVTMMGAGVCDSETADKISNVANLPILLIHGDKDPIIDPSCSQTTLEALRALPQKSPPVLHMLKDKGHELTLDGDDGLTLPFMADKVRTPWPSKITARFVDTTYPRQYWVELVGKKSGLASIDGQIKPGNTIELTTKNVSRLRLLLRPEMFNSAGPIKVLLNKTEVYHGELAQDCALLQRSSEESQDSSLGYTQALEFDVSR